MAIELEDNQWELGGVVFGAGCAIEHEPTATPPMAGRRTEDQPIPGRDGTAPGQDLFDPGVWAFQLYTNQYTQADALAALRDLSLVWRGDAYRKLPGRSTSLRYRIGGRTRVVYGRPREFDYTLGPEFMSGRIPITANFQTMSEVFYEDFETTLTIGHKEPLAGGFTTPIRPPFHVGYKNEQPGHPYQLVVGGDLPTPVLIDFKGPLDDSGLLIDGDPFIDFQFPIPAGVTVTVDARPWVMSVYRSDGAAVAGLLSPRSRMPKMLLEPGAHTATLLGTSPDGTGSALVRVRSAYPSV